MRVRELEQSAKKNEQNGEERAAMVDKKHMKTRLKEIE